MQSPVSVSQLLLFLTFSLHLCSGGTHFLHYLCTGVTPGRNFPEFTAVHQADGEQIVYYDSNSRKPIPKTEWIQKVTDNYANYWERETEKFQDQLDWFSHHMTALMTIFNRTEGVHTLQRMYGCELRDDSTSRVYDRYGYDGENFFSLDLKTGTWTGVNDQAENFITQWEKAGDEAEKSMRYLETDCIDWLKEFLLYGREKVHPTGSVFQKHSSSPEVVCHATGFFPKAVTITWQKDGEDVYEDVELRETLPNQDGSFQKRSILKVPAEELQKHTYTCVIQHSSLEKDVVLSVSERRILRGGGSDGGSDGVHSGVIVAVAIIGFIAVVAGIVIWKKNSDFLPVPVFTRKCPSKVKTDVLPRCSDINDYIKAECEV